MLLLLLLAIGVTANPGAAAGDTTTGGGHLPPLVDCAPGPVPSTDDNDVAFRASLASALAALPAVAAAAPDGFAVVQSRGGGSDRVFARGLCFFGVSATDCLACLSAAAREVMARCGHAGSRRAGAWRAGCFLSYADTGAPSAREDAFRGWFYAAQDHNATAARASQGGECAGDRTAADCGRCFEDSAQAAKALGWLPRIRGEQVVVVGYTCCLRVQISNLPQGPPYQSTPSLISGLWLQGMTFVASLIVILTFVRILEHLRYGN